MKILIIEDEHISQKKMEIIMSKYGICDSVANGTTAIEMFKKAWDEKSPFDLITLDITLHGINGLDVLLKIREFEKKNNIQPTMKAKVMMVTSHNDRDHVSTSATIGADGYVIKPFTNKSISLSLRKIYLKYIEDFLPI